MYSREAFQLLFLITYCMSISDAKIDPELAESFSSSGEPSDVLVSFQGENNEVLQSFSKKSFSSRAKRVSTLTTELQSLSSAMQSPVQDYLTKQNANFQTFWASNQLIIYSASFNLVKGVDAFSQVSKIQKVPTVQLFPFFFKKKQDSDSGTNLTYGLAKIQAEKVWEKFNITGEGVVVANIDTGVRGTHESLRDNFRADHGWLDPAKNITEPLDDHGHGTHTIGTIAGAGGIGVAPGAKWIACRGCAGQGCAAPHLLACGQWMLSPTNPDGSDPNPALIPDIVSNSWGSLIGGNTWYNATVKAWTAAGILNAFAIGNSGPLCATGGSPGDQPEIFAVGSTDKNDALSTFSSKGTQQVFGGLTKPDIVAPGSDVNSAWKDADDSYKTISGTSMATPHVAGVLALMLSAIRKKNNDDSKKISMEEMQRIIEQTADTKDLTINLPNLRCDSGIFPGTKSYPNNNFGHGRVNALKAVEAILGGPQEREEAEPESVASSKSVKSNMDSGGAGIKRVSDKISKKF